MEIWSDWENASAHLQNSTNLFCGAAREDSHSKEILLSNVHRCPELDPLAPDNDGDDFQLSNVHRKLDIVVPDTGAIFEVIDGDVYQPIQGNITRRPDIPLGQFECTEDFCALNRSRRVPNIDKGINKNDVNGERVDLEKFLADSLEFMVCGEALCVFDPPCWNVLDAHSAKVTIRRILEQHQLDSHITDAELSALYKLLRLNTSLQRQKLPSPPDFMLNLSDCTLDLRSLTTHRHSPKDYFFSYIDVSYREIQSVDTNGGYFEQFVHDISNGDDAVRSQLLELTALALTSYEAKHFFVLLGPSNTGKTQFGRFLEELVGREHVETLRGVTDFGERFAMGVLNGKKLATCLDLPDAPLGPSAIGMIKQMVGDDPVKGERKYKDPVTFYKKPLLLFAGNYAVQIPKASQEQALLNRMVIIPFSNPKEAHEMRHFLYKDLLEEAPYIVGEAIEAFRLLMKRNFQVTRSRIPEEYQTVEARETFNAVLDFISDCCTVSRDSEVSTERLFTEYERYAARRGLVQISVINFSRLLSEVFRQEGIEAEPVKRVSGSGQRGYRGIALKDF